MDLLKVLILDYLAILAINIALSCFLWFRYRENVYNLAVFFWIVTFLNFGIQGAFADGSLPMALAFSSGIAVILTELHLLAVSSGLRFPFKKYGAVHAVATVVAVLLSFVTDALLWVSMPVALSISGTMIHGAIVALRDAKKTTDAAGVRILATIILLHALHILDYPFLRENVSFAPIGFSIALIFLVAVSIVLPSFLTKSISDRYVAHLSEVTGRLARSQRELGEMAQMAKFGELSFGFVHDMASPISILTLYASQLSKLPTQDDLGKKKISEFAKGIGVATQRLGRMQQLFRNFVQREGIKETVEVDVDATLRDCVDLYEPAINRANAALSYLSSAIDPRIQTLAGTVDRVMINLIQNALNAISTQPKKEIALRLSDDAGGITIELSDSGPGIPPERLSSLWERFGFSTTARMQKSEGGVVSGGSGFGLYKIREMVNEAGGKIEVKKTGPEGTTFTLSLPRRAPVAT